MKYRAEIDGLRAFAVIPVILFHAGFEWFSGGFVGVDVFFVISGYLITTILIEDIENNRFSLVDFYERRARRILPALFFVMFVCIPFAWMWMFPNQMQDFSQSLIAVSLFASNIFFWLESGYFDAAAEEKPMLHTWSLAVEEQYYLLFPIFLILAWRFGRNKVFWTVVIFAACSLLLSEWGWRNKATANFYFAPTRAWELLAGSITAFLVNKRGVHSSNVLSIIGLALIFYAIFAYDKSTPFPSIYTLVPVIGVVLLIMFAEKQTLAAKLLSARVFVGIGLISYSAYLWHQPLFAFARIQFFDDPSMLVMSILSVVSLILGLISWRYIERPFRNKSSLHLSATKILACSIAGLTLFALFGLMGHLSGGFHQRINGWNELINLPDVASSYCHNTGRRTTAQLLNNDFCLIGKGSVEIAIIGDSHAGALFEYADEYLGKKNVAALAVSGGFCAPLLNGFEAKKGCQQTVELAVERVLSDKNIKKVILAAEWAVYSNGFRGDDKVGLWRDDDGDAVVPADNISIFSRSFDQTVVKLLSANKEVLIVHPVPEFYHDAYKWLGTQVLSGKYKSVSHATSALPKITLAQYYERNYEVFNVFDNYDERLSFLPTVDLFCTHDKCSQFDQKMDVLYSDFNHVNFLGAQLITEKAWADFLSQ